MTSIRNDIKNANCTNCPTRPSQNQLNLFIKFIKEISVLFFSIFKYGPKLVSGNDSLSSNMFIILVLDILLKFGRNR